MEMKKATAYVLSTCDTCKRILAEVGNADKLEVVDIKQHPLLPDTLSALHAAVGSYEGLFNNRAQKLKLMGVKASELTEDDRHTLLLHDYTFLRRPVFVVGHRVFAGNAPATVQAAKEALGAL